jgi:GT2 family glycosyltransferase
LSWNQRIGKTPRTLAPRDREIAQLKALVTTLQAQNSAILSSTSWRVTAPLREWRRALRVFYWLVTLQLARRLSERRLVRRINSSGLFDTAYYKSRYPDVAAAGIDPVLHYVVSGAAEGRNPSPDFDTAAYVAAYPEATRGGGNPLIHYYETGYRTGIAPPRPPRISAGIEATLAYLDLPAGPTDPAVDRPSVIGTTDDGRRLHRISVVVPLYNHERYIEQTLQSVLSQTMPAHEIIVIDDGSTDGSAARVDRLRERHPQIALWSKENGGAHSAINAGIERATGDLVAILNSDDIYHPDRLAIMLRELDGASQPDAVATALDFIDGDGRAIRNSWYEEGVAFYRRTQDLALTLINGNFLMTTSNLLMRRSLFDEIGGFSPLRYAHDLDFFLRLIARGKTIRLIRQPLLSYRQHPANTIKESALKVKAETAAAVAFFLNQLWHPADRRSTDWDQAGDLLAVLDDGGLTAPILLCMAYFREHPTDTMEQSPFHHAAAFRAVLSELVR